MSQDVIETDALIVGAGPCGLFQVFELGLLGVKAHVVDTMRVVGGQCAELYPDKPIYDIPGIPVINGQELVDNLMVQIEPFEPVFHLGEEVCELTALDADRFRVVTDAGTEFVARTVFVAGGVGSFQPRRLRFEGIEAFEDKSLFYRVRDPARFAGKRIAILGGGDSALDWTLALAPAAKACMLVHRREEYRGAPASVERMRALAANGKVEPVIGKVSGYRADAGAITAITVEIGDAEHEFACDALLVFYGLAPKLGPIADWGLDINQDHQCRSGALPDQHPGRLCHRRRQLLPGQEEAHPVRFPRGGAGRVRGEGAARSGTQGTPAIHDDEPADARAPGREAGLTSHRL